MAHQKCGYPLGKVNHKNIFFFMDILIFLNQTRFCDNMENPGSRLYLLDGIYFKRIQQIQGLPYKRCRNKLVGHF